MIDGNINQLIDILHYGGELFFEYHKEKYFIQGWWEAEDAVMVLDCLTCAGEDYLWKDRKKNMNDCANDFLEAALFDNKTFWEIEKEATWVDC